MSVALESRLRGGNRFRLLSQACVRIAQQGAAVPGLDGILHWVESGSELTHGALAARVKRGAGPALARALAWSREVNRRLTAMPKECAPFAAVEGCLAAVRAVADVVAMGTGTPAAVRGEWTRGGLSGYTDAVFAAPQDGKAEALIPVFGAGYLPSHMLVVGDTLGDAALAAQAGALFFPILPGREEACWQRLPRKLPVRQLLRTGHAAQGPAVALPGGGRRQTAHSINGKEERPMDGNSVRTSPGQQVEIVLKKTSPPAGTPVWCGASDKQPHRPHGIKVMLEDEQVGRVQAVLDAPHAMKNPSLLWGFDCRKAK
ncbi:MAG: DUF2196 domain-containing protein [Ruthenibacterium lactatiformans]